jgi:hypothetical protein
MADSQWTVGDVQLMSTGSATGYGFAILNQHRAS